MFLKILVCPQSPEWSFTICEAMCMQRHYIVYAAPASEMDPIDTEAALAAFDEYSDLTREYVEVNITMFTSKCVGYGVIPETSPITGASIFLPDSLKMDIVLPLIRNNIALNGKTIFHLMTRVLDSMGDYRQLARGFESTYTYTYLHTYIHTYLHTYVHSTYIHIRIHTYVHTYVYFCRNV